MDLSPKEVERNYAEKFGEHDGKTVLMITNSTSQLYQEWRLFLYFFTGPTERVDALNAASGTTARVLQNLLWDSAIMKVRRLTDPAKTGSNRNLSIQKLVQIASEKSSVDLRDSYNEVLEKVRACRKYADKHLVHRDLYHAIGPAQIGVNRKETTDAVRSIGRFVKEFHQVTRDTDYLLMPMSHPENEQQFLMRLHLGNERAEQLKTERYQKAITGELRDSSEYDWPNWIFDQKSQSPSYDFE